MQFKTACALAFKGDRVPRGAVVEMTAEEAARYGADLIPLTAAPAPETPEEVEKPLDKMSKDELVAKAESLGLETGGSKADLTDRISLHLKAAAPAPETPEEVV